MALMFRATIMAGALAGTTFIAAPASAATLPAGLALGAPSAAFDASRYDPASSTADWRCRWGCGWGRGGWGHRRGWRRGRVDVGDVLIGAAVIGGVAAILNSNNRRQRDRDVVVIERDRDTRYRDDRRAAPRGTGSAGLDSAVNQCLDRIERDVRVDTVDNVDRTGAGWQVSGVLFNGAPFQCRIGNNGQIDGIDYGGGLSTIGFDGSAASADPREDGQWDDQRYTSARAAVGSGLRPDFAAQDASGPVGQAAAPVATAATDRMPAYPGGPIPGEDIPETIDGDL
ncbi:hypothetical protein C0V72_03575 [Porphyrobacter sp. TH134]|uniref:hypothetical protein n=1 Tax=Porphyrobacter sp. TH134 TaxID=2067450 RepID=UPI000CC82404|nr:hypothetical protein [Porphyrobacter sp. TH134]PLK24835.1 hypothetical protein C0V72_03575 [Porphyrobacter sp. TH134]